MPQSSSRLPARPSLEQLRKQAKELLRLFRSAETAALARLHAVLPRLATTGRADDLTLADAQFVLAREYGFENWAALAHHLALRLQLGHPRSAAYGMSATPPFYRIDWATNTIEPRPPLSDKDWDTIVDVMQALEKITLWQTAGVTNNGVAALASLPRLRELKLDGLPKVTRESIEAFPATVRVALSGVELT